MPNWQHCLHYFVTNVTEICRLIIYLGNIRCLWRELHVTWIHFGVNMIYGTLEQVAWGSYTWSPWVLFSLHFYLAHLYVLRGVILELYAVNAIRDHRLLCCLRCLGITCLLLWVPWKHTPANENVWSTGKTYAEQKQFVDNVKGKNITSAE